MPPFTRRREYKPRSCKERSTSSSFIHATVRSLYDYYALWTFINPLKHHRSVCVKAGPALSPHFPGTYIQRAVRLRKNDSDDINVDKINTLFDSIDLLFSDEDYSVCVVIDHRDFGYSSSFVVTVYRSG